MTDLLAELRTQFPVADSWIYFNHAAVAPHSLRVDRAVRGFLDDALAADPELDATLEWYLMVGATEIDGADPIVQSLAGVSHTVLGHTPRLDAFPGATDAAYIQAVADVPCIASFGPGFLPRAHSPNESMHKDGAAQAAMIYALAALDYLSEPRDDRS